MSEYFIEGYSILDLRGLRIILALIYFVIG